MVDAGAESVQNGSLDLKDVEVPEFNRIGAEGDAMAVNDRKTGKPKLIKATYQGLAKAHDKEYYRWFPDYIPRDPRRLF